MSVFSYALPIALISSDTNQYPFATRSDASLTLHSGLPDTSANLADRESSPSHPVIPNPSHITPITERPIRRGEWHSP